MNRKRLVILGVMVGVFAMLLNGCGNSDKHDVIVETEASQNIKNSADSENETVEVEENAIRMSGELEIAEGALKIENVSPYTGTDFRNNTFESSNGVYAIKVTNQSEQVIDTANLIFNTGEQEVSFSVSFLPPGASVISTETDQKLYKQEELIFVESDIKYIDINKNSIDDIIITFENGNVVVRNRKDEFLPLLWVVCTALDDDDTALGAPYIAIIDGLEPNGEQIVEAGLPDGYYSVSWVWEIEE